MSTSIGTPFRCEELAVADVLAGLGPYVVCANDPPWSAVARTVPAPLATVAAWDMDVDHLAAVVGGLADGGREAGAIDGLADGGREAGAIDGLANGGREAGAIDGLADGARVRGAIDGATVVGLGGGTALDTAKYVAWRLGRPLVQVPSITSVDAAFTDAIGVRDGGHVRYIGRIEPELVVLDLDLVRSAPPHLNRAGIGDVLSCHTGLFDWRLAAEAGQGAAWDEPLAALGRTLLAELDAAADDVAAVSVAGVRFLADAYRRIGAACAHAGHSRFEEGSEHFWAYAYEHRTGAHPVHGEIIALGVALLAHVQGNEPAWVADLIGRSGVRAHPADLGVAEADVRACLTDLAGFARGAGLDVSVVDLRPVTAAQVDAAWAFVSSLPRR